MLHFKVIQSAQILTISPNQRDYLLMLEQLKLQDINQINECLQN
jgi:hypothetical protein